MFKLGAKGELPALSARARAFVETAYGVERNLDLYEAASIDGASNWEQFKNVTLPGLRPTFVFILITITIAAFSLFTQIDVMTSGGPANATTTLVYHIIQMGSGRGDVGYASALSLIFFLIVLTITLIQRKLTKED